MKIQVDYTKCTGRGVCESFAPSPFEINHDGDVVRHCLSRAGNRQLNCCLHVMAITQVRQDTPGRAYYLRKRFEGRSHNEAMRCLKRRLSDLVYRGLIHDADKRKAGPRTPDTVVASVGRFDGLICGLLACKLHGSVVDAQ